MYFFRLVKQAEYVDFYSCGDDAIDGFTQELIDTLKVEDSTLFERLLQTCPIGTSISDYLDVFVKPFNSTIKQRVEECCNGFNSVNWQNIFDFYL